MPLPPMGQKEAQRAASNAMKLLDRVDLKGSEVGAFIPINQLLGQISNGELVVVPPESLRQAAHKPDLDE